MTDTKPTLPELIALFDSGKGINVAALIAASDYLKELAAIKSQPVPVEPECVIRMRRLDVDPTWDVAWETLKYIDSLFSALQVAQHNGSVTMDELGEMRDRSEKAEAELAALRLELARLDGEIPYGN